MQVRLGGPEFVSALANADWALATADNLSPEGWHAHMNKDTSVHVGDYYICLICMK
jgi:hypothetical protein